MSASLSALLNRERGRLLLRIEVSANGHWQRSLDTTQISFRRAVSVSLRPPRHYRRTRVFTKRSGAGDVTASTANVPASLFYFGAGPVSLLPQISAIYWGKFFHDSPGVVATLNRDLAQMASDSDGYTGPLTQYGVMTGSFNGSVTLNFDPPKHVGSIDVYSIENMLFTHLHGNLPRSWGIFSSTSPIVMIFVPASVVDSGSWSGYHFYVPTEEGLLPWNFPAVPWTIAKVPDTVGFNPMIDTTMVNASHEFVEAATDPYPFTAWTDPEKHPVFALGEAADVCSTGNTQPWGAMTRLNGVAYSTYWSNMDSACVPESRPTVTITSPAAGSTSRCPSVAVSATAVDPFDGRLPARSLMWSVDGTAVTPMVGEIRLSPGPHMISVTAADSQRLVGRASETITVAPPPAPTASIAAPPPSSTWGSDQSIAFSGSATDACDGTLSGSALVWTENGATLGTGSAISHMFAQGQHTVTLTATNSSGLAATATVTFTVGPPSGNPSPAIQQPVSGQNVDINQPVTFEGSATDPTDGTLSGGSLQWYDTYSDATGGCGCSVNLGSGTSFRAKLPADPRPATHVITLVATDSLGHSARTSVTITSANFQ